MTAVDVQRRKELRRNVLVALRACFGDGYQGWLSERSLFSVLKSGLPDLTGRELHEAVVYSGAAGYAENRTQPHDKRDAPEVDWRITNKGVNLLDQVIEADPGIEDDRE
jgi:hypothetical protein